MIYYWVLPVILCITGVAASSSSNGVCKTETKVPRIEKVTYTEKKRCASYESCWYRNVKKTKSQVVFDTHNSYYCCPGYKKKGPTGLELNTSAISCEPVCSDPCVNGKCSSPGKCDCLPGFRKTKSDHICEPVCEPACINAECEPGNKCTCHIGYEKVGDKCNPICSDGCVDGYCLKPEICACNASYILSLNGTVCEPVCKRDCENGKCVAPNRCECFEGYVEGEDWNLCKPYCPEPCENSMCTAPGVCTCFVGYEKDGDKCNPICSDGCVDGYCLQPEICACNESYILTSNGTACEPVCEMECENGKCVSPNHCECFEGYVESEDWNLCKPYCPEPCENSWCTAPNVCTCFEGYDQLVGENRSHQCVPRCSTECLNGECIAPDECGCNQGFEMDLDKQQCVPLCSNGCDNGICVATEKCSCNKGYRNSNESCIPHCDHPCVNGDCTAPNECTCNNGTLKASTYHCLLTCANTRQDRCFHESLVPMTSSLIQHSDTSEIPFIDFPEEKLLSVPCSYLSSVNLKNGFLESHYQCYIYLDFEENSLMVVCSVDSETKVSSESYNQTLNMTEWMSNSTSLQTKFMNVLFVHQEVSSYCTAQLCPTSNRRLYLNALSNISVCKERPAENRKEPIVWPAWNLMAAACIACILIVTLSVVAWRHCRKVSYIIDDTDRHQMFEGITNETLSYEQLESVELTDENEPIIASSNFK